MRLTKRKALEMCIEVWDWLAKHPRSDKYDATFVFPWLETMDCYCPCCEYMVQSGPRRCSSCPLVGRWGGDRESEKLYGCMADDTHYQKYYHTETNNTRSRSRHAKRIADAARAALAELGPARRKKA